MGGRAWRSQRLGDVRGPSAGSRRGAGHHLPPAAVSLSIVYDTAVLVAADRSDRRLWADHRARLELDIVPLTTAPVVAQASRSPRQVELRRFLRGCDVAALSEAEAHEVGSLVGTSGVSDVVDVHVVLVASRTQASVLTSDDEDLRRIATVLEDPVRVVRL